MVADVRIPAAARRPKARTLIKQVLAEYNMSPDQFFGRTSTPRRTRVRREICIRMFKELKYHPTIIGWCLGIDRTTVLHHLNRAGVKRAGPNSKDK